MNALKNRLLFGNMLGLFVLAYAFMAGPGRAAPSATPNLAPVGTSFIYEGRLGTLTGTYDFQFRLFDTPTAGALVGTPSSVLVNDRPVTQGEYLVQLNFGTAAFTGDARYLEVSYRPGSSTGAYTQLASRQPIYPVAYALSLRPGATMSGNVPSPGAVVRGTNTGSGIGLAGTTATGIWGVYGEHTATMAGAGVQGRSTNWYGVRGDSTNGQGVWGASQGSHGVVGKSVVANGVYGETSAAHTASIAGIYGKSSGDGGIGVIGEARVGNTWGVYGATNNGAGVHGQADGSGVGVSGLSTGGTSGVYGEASLTGAAGVRGKATGGAGSAGVSGSS